MQGAPKPEETETLLIVPREEKRNHTAESRDPGRVTAKKSTYLEKWIHFTK